MILMDIFIISCIGFNMLLGYKKGFIWSFFGLASYLVAAICSRMFYLDVATVLRNYTGLFTRLEGFMKVNFSSYFPESAENTAELGAEAFKGMGLIGEYLIKDVEIQTYAHQTAEMVKEEIVKGIANLLLNVISMILIFVIVKAAILLMGNLLDQLFKLPVLNGLNKTGGLFIGGIKGLLLVMVVLVVMFVFATLSPNGVMASAIENSLALQFFFNDLFPPLMDWLL